MMSTASLPPRGIFIPTHIIFNTQLSAAVLVTWIKLRCLAWEGWATPPMSIPELASHIGIHPNRLNRQLSALQDIAALSLRANGQGKLIISFMEPPVIGLENPVLTWDSSDTGSVNYEDRRELEHSSYFPRQIMGYLLYEDGQEELLELGRFDDINYFRVDQEKSCLDP